MVLGALSGLVVAICGAIKDAPYEGFNMMTFIRSPVIGALETQYLTRPSPTHPSPLFSSAP